MTTNTTYLIATIVFLVFAMAGLLAFGYFVALGRRARDLEEMEAERAALAERAATPGPRIGEWRVRVNPHNGECYCERRVWLPTGFEGYVDWKCMHTAANEAAAKAWIEREKNGWKIIPIEPEPNENEAIGAVLGPRQSRP